MTCVGALTLLFKFTNDMKTLSMLNIVQILGDRKRITLLCGVIFPPPPNPLYFDSNFQQVFMVIVIMFG